MNRWTNEQRLLTDAVCLRDVGSTICIVETRTEGKWAKDSMSEHTMELNGATVTIRPFGVVHAHDNTRQHQRPQEDWVCLEFARSEGDNDSFNESRFAVKMQSQEARELAEFLIVAGGTAEADYPCQRCGTPCVNVAEGDDVDLACPSCGWHPVEVTVR